MNKLTKENKERILENGVYKWLGHIPQPGYISGYHCKNWIFIPRFLEDGRVLMLDTYFKSSNYHKIEITDENFDKFEFVFDKTKVSQIGYDTADRYRPEDLYRNIAMDSGGYSCSSCIWVDRDTPYDIDRQIAQMKREVESAKSNLKWREQDLEKLLKEKGSD